ncbi:MAG: hypothetical protein SFU83_03205 [Meiothermus sp.]|nr:hypothetical protein [Meiothermus sp.]
MSLDALKKEARSLTTSVVRLEELARVADAGIQLAVANNPNSSSATLIYLSGHGKFNILKAVARNRNTPGSSLEKLSAHKHHTVREAVAGNPNLAPPLIEHLAEDPRSEVVYAVLVRHIARVPLAVQERLARCDDVRVRTHVFLYGLISQATRDALLREGLVELNHATMEKASPSVLDHFSASSLDGLRVFIAASPKTTPQTLTRLSSDALWEVRAEVAGNPNTPVHSLGQLSVDPAMEVRRRVVANPALSASLLDVLSCDRYGEIRYRVAMHPSTTCHTLQRLTNDPDNSIRMLARQNLLEKVRENV